MTGRSINTTAMNLPAITIHANFVRGDRYSLVAALSVDGYEVMSVVQGSVDVDSFFHFIMHDVVRPSRFPLLFI